MRRAVAVVVMALACVLVPLEAAAQKRVALVIGNSAYEHTSRLENPKNDAADMAAALRKVGFQVVDGFDLNKTDFERRVRDFAVALRGAEVGLFFYAGHGLQVAGQNYLVPIDARAETADALDWEMVRLDLVHRTMERATSTNIIFLDACRNNPLARNLARTMGTRSADIGKGLAAVESGVGTLISFSTQPGNVALDGQGRNSPFAAALAKRVATSGDDLSALLIDVRNDVRKETQNAQVPWEHSALTGRFYFTPPKPGALSAPPQDSLSEAAQSWAAIKDTRDIRTLEAFRRQYGAANPLFDRLAEARIEELKKLGTGGSVPSQPQEPAARPIPSKTVGNYEVSDNARVVGGALSTHLHLSDLQSCMSLCNVRSNCAGFDFNTTRCALYSAASGFQEVQGSTAGIRRVPAAPPPAAQPSAGGSVVAGYEVERLSSITGSILDASNIRIDASKPEEAIALCARLCDGSKGCTAFDISVVYGKCTLYRGVEKKGSLGGYISGVKSAK